MAGDSPTRRIDVRGLLVDIDGVLVTSWQPIPGAADALATCRRAGIALRCLTNTTSVSRAEISARLNAAGVVVDTGEIMSAPAATAAWLNAEHPGARCYLINSGDLGDDFAGVHVVDHDQHADVVVLGGAGEEFSYTQMNHALGLLLDGAPLVGMQRNMYWRTETGFNLDTGAYLTALEQAAGVTATVLGKPSGTFFSQALDDMGVAAHEAAMIGDDIENDVLGGQAIGLTGILVRTGKFRPQALDAAAGVPDVVIESIANLTDLVGLR
jgi:HAD superfamily hydrolase (TIGR01458 family)